MFSEEVETKDGAKKMVYAEDEKALAEAVKNLKAQEMPTYPNINHPVAKGHDLVSVEPDLGVKLVDGTGAHNSPNNAVDPFNGTTDSAQDVLGMDEPAYKSQGDPGNVRDRAADAAENRQVDSPATNVRGAAPGSDADKANTANSTPAKGADSSNK